MMRIYETVLVIVFFTLTAVLVWNGIKAYPQVRAEEDKKLRAASRRKVAFLIMFGLMFFFSALYIIFRVSWMFMIMFFMGSVAFAYAIGSGIGANTKEHGR